MKLRKGFVSNSSSSSFIISVNELEYNYIISFLDTLYNVSEYLEVSKFNYKNYFLDGEYNSIFKEIVDNEEQTTLKKVYEIHIDRCLYDTVNFILKDKQIKVLKGIE